jgi:signal transduction histidine kinase
VVRVCADGDFARYEVQDEGPGLSKEDQERIWQRYYRVNGIMHQTGSGPGLGLGLFISKTIIERHGGEVGVESEPGKGSTFWFKVPLSSTPDSCDPS